MSKKIIVSFLGILTLTFLFNAHRYVYAEMGYEPEKVDWEERYVQKLNEIHSPEKGLSEDELACFNDVYSKEGSGDAESALEQKYIPSCYRQTNWKSTKATLGCVYSQTDFFELAQNRVWQAINLCKKNVKKTAPFPTELEEAPLSKEEQYNQCVDKCFLNKVLSICPDDYNRSACIFNFVNARNECLRKCKPPKEFQRPKTSNRQKTITQDDYRDNEVITLNGLPINKNTSVNTSYIDNSPTIEETDFEAAKSSKPQDLSGKSLEVWVADIKGFTDIYVATGSSDPAWIAAKTGDILPQGVKIFVAKDSSLLIGTDFGILKVTGLTYLTITKATLAATDGKKLITLYIDLSLGKIEADLDKGEYELDMQINTLSSVAKVTGTHFFVAFNDDNKQTETGVFDGEIDIESLITGQNLVLTALADSKSRLALIPLEVNEPTPVEEPVTASKEESQDNKTNVNGFIPAILLLLVAGGTGLYLYKKGKLKSLYEKYIKSHIPKNIGRNSEEKKTE
ncbi:hypothetical protein A2773_04890 [Candidatus Gottesmanbacteria bacterium RIFCSPHIGHO2_01_FULL_39_10]|uniref:Uncharacterized protein n=1 Tax=Candidatus Gottesmanbacteria bacterium RIFCSPHIGHO2_01_FULL_39_10 TaxID=1798375 RepID=A0A1F5ZS41_9BACT|nr:MAG: hypothetical protein A2773_04890 [Candidatus Gottesmanbacteria bacterium RIFCSPHIGHO2_01_FULL_39_10]